MSKLSEKIVGLLGLLTEGADAREQATAEKMKDLEEELQDLREKLEQGGGDEEKAQLKRVIALIKEKMIEQNEVLAQLTSAPLAHAVVLYVDDMKALPPVESISTRDVKPGMKVRVLVRPHPFFGKICRVVRGVDRDGDILVRDEKSGGEHYVRVTQNKNPNAEPLDGPTDDFDSFSKGKRVRVLDGNYRGQIGTIVREIDGDDEINVQFEGGDTHYIFVGKIFGQPIEIITGNSRKATSVVVAYEGKRLELQYPEELLQEFSERGNQNAVDSKEEFHIGDRVRIRRDSKFSGQNSGEGTIQAWENDSWARVEFDDGLSNSYRIGKPEFQDGAVDLELVERRLTVEEELSKGFEMKFLQPGDIVKLSLETMQIVAVVGRPRVSGEISFVRGIIDKDVVEVEYQGATRVVHNGNGKVEVGDRVILDPTISIILRNLGKEDGKFSFALETNVSWDDIGGLAEAKESMIEAIELPFRYPDLYRGYNKKPVKGVLLYGPPGCGKTMLGKATATALARIHKGGGVSSGFMYVKGPEILDRFVGSAETTIRQIFQRSRKHRETYGYPAVIFIDEADAILGRRGMGISSDVERTIVPMFLAEMDGLEDSGAFLLLATNRPDVLDSAVVRDGRIDRKIRVGHPDVDSALDIFRLYLKNVPLYEGHSVDTLAEMITEELFVFGNYGLYSICLKESKKDRGTSELKFSLKDLCSGAMIAGIVDQATSIALRRDMEHGLVRGISPGDLVGALRCVYHQSFHLDHSDELADFVHDFRDDVLSIKKLGQATA